MKGFGFNGCRIHQKVEQPLLYYLADRFGFLLWSELPSCYEYSNKMKEEINNDLFNIIDQNLTDDEAIDQAVQKAKDKIVNQLKEKEYIIDAKKLKVEKNNSKIIVEVFISVCENITDYKEIIEMEPIEE